MRFFAVVGLAGCVGGAGVVADTGERPSGSTCGAPGPSVEPGAGGRAWEVVDDGEGVLLVTGSQGGPIAQHVDAAGRVSGVRSPVVAIEPSLYWPAGDLQLTDDVPCYHALVEWDEDRCVGAFYGVQARLSFDPDFDPGVPLLDFVCGLEGEQVEYRLVITDVETGATTTEVRTVILRQDPETSACP